MFGIGLGEMLLIGVILLVAVGPQRLPVLMKALGKGMREVRKASSDLRRTVGIDQMMREADDVQSELRGALNASTDSGGDPQAEPSGRALTPSELEEELPEEGVDVAEAAHLAGLEAGVPRGPAAPPTPSPLASSSNVPPPLADSTDSTDSKKKPLPPPGDES